MPWEKELEKFLVAHLCCGSDTRQKLGSEMASAALQGSSAKRLASKETLSSATARQQEESPKSCIDVGATPKTQVDEVPAPPPQAEATMAPPPKPSEPAA